MYPRSKCKLAVLPLFAAMLTGCSGSPDAYPVYNHPDDLKGKTIGVMLGWESDFDITPVESQYKEVMRFDNFSDMVMALRFHKVDALLMDSIQMKTVEAMTTGIRHLEEPFSELGYLVTFGSQNQELCEDFNRFLEEYNTSPLHDEAVRCVSEFDGLEYNGPIVEATGTGETLVIGYDILGFPRVMEDPETGKITGFDTLALITWANERNYHLEFVGSTFDDVFMGLSSGKYDAGIGYYSTGAASTHAAGGTFPSDPFELCQDYFLVADGEITLTNSTLFD